MQVTRATLFRKNAPNLLTIFIFLFVTFLFAHIHTFSGDYNCWGGWCAYIQQHGLAEAYSSGTNYLPLYQYVLWAFGMAAGSEEAIWRA